MVERMSSKGRIMKTVVNSGKWTTPDGKCGTGKACLDMDSSAKPVRKPGNSHISRTLLIWLLSPFNPLPSNLFQLNQSGGFPGLPGKFPWDIYGGAWKVKSAELEVQRKENQTLPPPPQ
jgi:hypothetical protein